jgi:hypothetical protein
MLPLFTALADPYPSNISVTVIDENSVLVAWQDNAWAQSYHVHRNDFVAELAEDENSYLDTGLTPAVPYCYRVCSIVDGVEYTADDAIWVAPLNTPEITGTGFVPNNMDEYISIQITWTPVDHATGYVLYSMEEGEYVSLGYIEPIQYSQLFQAGGEHYLPVQGPGIFRGSGWRLVFQFL